MKILLDECVDCRCFGRTDKSLIPKLLEVIPTAKIGEATLFGE